MFLISINYFLYKKKNPINYEYIFKILSHFRMTFYFLLVIQCYLLPIYDYIFFKMIPMPIVGRYSHRRISSQAFHASMLRCLLFFVFKVSIVTI